MTAPGNVRPASDIRRLGFKSWFERQLIESHLCLVTAFLCLILVLAVFEEMGSRTGWLDEARLLVLIVVGVALGIVSWDRYRVILFRALRLSERSVCEKCRAYARFSVIDSGRSDASNNAGAPAGTWLRVKCKKCGYEWTMG